ncbi:MAG: hypothetical protein H0W05_07135 [Thermoleophilaceae bacterium]|nr:hypothetical protein [Thermoleophilaceae bacterium]
MRTDVAAAFLIDGLFEAAVDRLARPLEPESVATLDRALAAVAGDDAGRGKEALAARLARGGYATRVAESERFEPARESSPVVGRLLDERFAESRGDAIEASVLVSAELALTEPAERPLPDDERAASWRVPGPGGHVRHHVARRFIQRETAQDGRTSTTEHVEEQKRFWFYGFFIRCCEECRAAERTNDGSGPGSEAVRGT